MAIQTIVTYGHPALRIPASPVLQIDEEILQIIHDLKDTLYHVGGLGLAAPQIGISKQIFIADLTNLKERKYIGNKVVFINPEIIQQSKKLEADNEGCLSLIEVRGTVARPFKIKMKGLLPSGNIRIIEAKGLFARCLQHEFDHLYGRLFIDYFSDQDKEKNREFMNKYLEENKKNLPKIME